MARGQDGVGVTSIIDLVLVKKENLHFVHYVREARGMGRGWWGHGLREEK